MCVYIYLSIYLSMCMVTPNLFVERRQVVDCLWTELLRNDFLPPRYPVCGLRLFQVPAQFGRPFRPPAEFGLGARY